MKKLFFMLVAPSTLARTLILVVCAGGEGGQTLLGILQSICQGLSGL